MWLCLKLCTEGVLNVAAFNTVYRLGTECGCVEYCVQTGYLMWLCLILCTDGVLNVAVFYNVYRLGTECGCFLYCVKTGY